MQMLESGSFVRRFASTVVLALAVLADPALAQKADRPTVKVGDQWQFVLYYGIPSTAPNRAWVVESVTPTGIEGTENGEPLMLTPDLNVLESPRSKESNPGLLRFPLEVGKQWRFATDYMTKDTGAKGRADCEVTVVGHEIVRVPAGEFDAFKLESKFSFRGISKVGGQQVGESISTHWYAPAARAVVKSVTRNPYRGTYTVELIEFQLQP